MPPAGAAPGPSHRARRRPLPRARGLLLLGLAGGLAACRGGGTRPAASPAATSVVDEAKTLIAQGDADGALLRLQGASQTDGEVLFLEGLAWARKAENAPLPTPEAPVSPSPRGAAPPPPPELKAEEAQALSFFEKAVAARPELAAAHQAIADLLAPHALRHEAQGAAARAPGSRRREAVPPAPSPSEGPDLSVERVLLAYRQAAQADRSSKAVVEAWIDFARRAGRLEEADAAFQQLLQRDRENAAPFVRYGDFLATERKDDLGAIAQYSQALIWQPSLEEARAKIADIYLAQAASHLERREYATALARLGDAKKYVGAPASPQGERLRQLQAEIAQIRGR